MRHPRFCLAHHPGISCSITNATHFSKPPTLANRHPYPHWRTTHVTDARTQPTLARHPRYQASHASTPLMTPTLAQIARHFSDSWISNLAFKAFNSQIPTGNLAVFTFSFHFYSRYYLGLLKHSHRSLENCHRRLNFFRGN